jgi:uncharacterized membrane protein
MAVFALVLCLVETIVFSILYYWFPRYLFSLKLSAQAIDTIQAAVLLVDDFLFAAVLILLIGAAFIGRDREGFTINKGTNNQ